MDKYLADKLTARFRGKAIAGWTIEDQIGFGKSAVVFRASQDSHEAALKVFDPEIIDRYGKNTQRQRIERERSLIGKSHPNLIGVYDGGEYEDLLFVTMELFRGENLSQVLPRIPPTEIRSLISQIASGAKYLEDVSFAHRDIKPENIGISDDLKSAKLLDFGVLRPFDLSNITDVGGQLIFVGTLQYSPPELLFREEEQSIEAWRAITFYQLGAVLHDLLMQKSLFEEFCTPYARLVRAVERETPLVDNPKVDPDLRLLAQNCLIKDPRRRLDTVKWEDFSKPRISDPLDSARRRIAQHRVAATQTAPAPSKDLLTAEVFSLRSSIDGAVVATTKTESFPRYTLKVIRSSQPYLLRVLFEPSEKTGLACYFSVFCQGTVKDAAAHLRELRIWACAGSTVSGVILFPHLRVSINPPGWLGR